MAGSLRCIGQFANRAIIAALAQCPGGIREFAKLPVIPLVVTADGVGLLVHPDHQPMDELQPEPWAHPADAVARFVSILIEAFGDEWGE